MALTTTQQVDPAVAVFYDRVLLERAKPELVHDKFAQTRPLPSKSGNTIKFRRYAALTPATTPLQEGVTPAGSQLSKTDLTAQIAFYGDFISITDVVDLTVEDPVLTEAAEILGEQAGQTIDALIRDVLVACASQSNASGGSNGKTPTEPAASDFDQVVKILKGANAKMISEVIPAGDGVGTVPIRPAYFAICHTDLIDALEAISGFKATAEYAQQGPVMEAEWGAYKNTRFLVSSVAHKTEGTPDAYKVLVLGKNAYGITEITEGSLKNIVKPFGSAGTADPLDQRATSGWKVAFTCRILNDSFMHVLNCTNKSGS